MCNDPSRRAFLKGSGLALLSIGFAGVAAGPLVRSSYRAAELLAQARVRL